MSDNEQIESVTVERVEPACATLTPEQLKIIFALATRADVKVSDIPTVWAALSPLDVAVKAGHGAVFKAL